jgi:hypothetical protein
MTRWLGLIGLLSVWPVAATGQDLTVKGNMLASWTSLTRISPAQDAVVHDGDTVTVTVSGQIDINQETRHETHCDLWVFCHDETIPVHNFRSPGQIAVVVEIRTIGGGLAVASTQIGAAPGVLQLPTSDSSFETQYEIVALLDGAGSSVDPGRSAGSFDIRVDIDASRRASYFKTWLDQTHPSASRATDPTAIADDLRTQGTIVAAALRQYAAGSFPVPNPTNNDSHARLVRKAVDLAPGDVENTLALARYLRAVGLDVQADAELAKVVDRLENLGDPHSRRQLGDAYMARMAAALSKGGGVDPVAAQAALSFADNAVKSYGQANRSDLVSEAHFARARLLRGMRTRESLTAAAEAYKAALADVPDTVAAETVLETTDGRLYALKVSDAVSLSSFVDGPRPLDPGLTDQQPIAWDPVRQRLLVFENSGLVWLSLRLDAPKAAPDVSPGILQVGDGAIARIKDFQSVDYFSSDQVATNLPVAGSGATTCTALPPSLAGGVYGMTMSLDGSVVAVICNSTVRVFHHSSGRITQVLEKALPPTALAGTSSAVAGPATCGTVVVTRAYPGQTATSLTLLRAGNEFKLTSLPSGPGGQLPIFIGPDQITFAADHILVATSDHAISKFRCSDGGSDGEITLPSVQGTPVGQSAPVIIISFRWLTESNLAVIRPVPRSVDVISWPDQKVSHFDAHADLSSFDLQLAAQLLLPPASGVSSPRMLKPHRRTELTEHSPQTGVSVVSMDVPGNREPIVPTADGTHLIVQRLGGTTWVVENKVSPNVAKGPPDEVALDTFGTASGWIAGKLNAESRLVALRTTDASGTSVPVPLPDPPASYYASIVTALPAVYTAWKQMPNAPEFPGWFQNKDLPSVIADPSLLTVNYNVQAAGLVSELPFAAFAPNSLPSLSSARGSPSLTICATAAARPMAGAPALPMAQFLPDLLYLGVQSGGALSFREVPDPNPTGPPGPFGRPQTCLFKQLVRGAFPTLIGWGLQVGDQKLKMLTQAGWVTTNITQAAFAGWSAADGSVLLLVPDVAPPGQIAKFSLMRVKNDGSSAAACGLCTALPLQDAFNSLAPTSPLSPSFAQFRFQAGGISSMIMVDAKGRLLARPSEDETVVVSLTDDKVLKRAPLGKPVFVSDHMVAISSPDKRVRFYAY